MNTPVKTTRITIDYTDGDRRTYYVSDEIERQIVRFENFTITTCHPGLDEVCEISLKDQYTKEQFDEVVYATGYVHLIKACGPPGDGNFVYTVNLEGEFTSEALKMIDHAMNNHPEWFKLNDPA